MWCILYLQHHPLDSHSHSYPPPVLLFKEHTLTTPLNNEFLVTCALSSRQFPLLALWLPGSYVYLMLGSRQWARPRLVLHCFAWAADKTAWSSTSLWVKRPILVPWPSYSDQSIPHPGSFLALRKAEPFVARKDVPLAPGFWHWHSWPNMNFLLCILFNQMDDTLNASIPSSSV